MLAPRFVDRIEHNGKVVETLPTETLVERMCSKESIEAIYERMIAADVAGDNMRSAVKQNPEESGGCSLKKNRSALFDMNHLGRKQRERREDILAADVRKKRTT